MDEEKNSFNDEEIEEIEAVTVPSDELEPEVTEEDFAY